VSAYRERQADATENAQTQARREALRQARAARRQA
jgi:hypothetical protein